ncbi:hypothetical protein [Streptacidiphilus melanogenes]|uniref:hypothetical protein n=1 Tax=Streptacidiphilus melanogenes TaxID=411235 RepID=UPI0005A914BA|nr:hypothetical protein [Streptacidiphilus melanogenes]
MVSTAGPVLSADGAPVAPGVGGHAVREAGMPASTGTAVLRMPQPLSVTAAIAASTAADSAAVAARPRRTAGPFPTSAVVPDPVVPLVVLPAVVVPLLVVTPRVAADLLVTALVRADLVTVRWVVLIA